MLLASRFRFLPSVFVPALALALGFLPAPALAQEPGSGTVGEAWNSEDEANRFFKEGNDHYAKRDWEAAYKAYTKAFELKRSYDIAGNLGDVELTLGRHRAAAEHLAFSLRHWPTGKAEAKERTRARLAEAKKKCGAVKIRVDGDAEIFVNRRKVGRAPIDYEVFVEPGAVHIEARRADGRSARRTIALSLGEAQSIRLTLRGPEKTEAPPPKTAAKSVGPDPGASKKRSGIEPKTIALVAGGALTVVSLGLWVGFGLAAEGSASDAEALRSKAIDEVGEGGCRNAPSVGVCQELGSTNDSGQSQKSMATVGAVGTGIFAAATLGVWLFWPESEDKETAGRPSFSPRIGKDQVGWAVSGSF